jgi:CBS-domain-containing membrane protein
MEPGPSTVRADTPAEDLAERLARRDLRTAIVSTPEGKLIGVVLRSDLESAS